MSVVAWVGLAVFVLAIIGFVYSCRDSGERRSGRSNDDSGGMPPGGDILQ